MNQGHVVISVNFIFLGNPVIIDRGELFNSYPVLVKYTAQLVYINYLVNFNPV